MTKFIRVRGRVIPIRDNSYSRAAKLGVVSGAAIGAGIVGSKIAQSSGTSSYVGKIGSRLSFLAPIGYGLGLAGTALAVRQGMKAKKDKFSTGLKHYGVSALSGAAGQIAGSALTGAGIGYAGFRKVKSLMRARAVARIGYAL